MGKIFSYLAVLGVIATAVDENLKKEISKFVSFLTQTHRQTKSGMDEITKTIRELGNSQLISFNLGNNQFSLGDLYNYFSTRVLMLWNSGETLTVVVSILVFVLGIIALVLAPIFSLLKYVVAGVKDRSMFRNKLRVFFLEVGIEAGVGIALVLYFVKFISL